MGEFDHSLLFRLAFIPNQVQNLVVFMKQQKLVNFLTKRLETPQTFVQKKNDRAVEIRRLNRWTLWA